MLCFGLLGRFEPLLDRRGVRDGLPAPPAAIAALYLLSGVLFLAARLLRSAPEGSDAARLAACWGLLRATRWLQEALQLPGSDQAVAIVAHQPRLRVLELQDATGTGLDHRATHGPLCKASGS